MKEAVDSFLNHLVVEKGFSRNTLEAYRNDLSQFVQFAQSRGVGESPEESAITPGVQANGWRSVDRSMLTDYVSDLRSTKSYRDTTTARKVASLKSFFNFLVQEEAISEDPTESLAAPKVGRNLPKFLSEEDVERLLVHASRETSPEGKRDWAMLELLYATGLRVSELVSLNTVDVNLQEGYVRCMGKGSRERIAYIYPRAVDVLGTYLNDARPLLIPQSARSAASTDSAKSAARRQEKALFVNQRGDRLTRQWVWSVLKACARRASIGKPITPHILRHSFATHMLRGGASLRHVQQLLGHSSITTTQVYTHLTDDHVRSEYERSHPRS